MEKITDSEVLKKLLDMNNWTQEQLAEELLFDRSQVSRVIHGKTGLRPLTRQKAEELLKKSE